MIGMNVKAMGSATSPTQAIPKPTLPKKTAPPRSELTIAIHQKPKSHAPSAGFDPRYTANATSVTKSTKGQMCREASQRRRQSGI